MATLAEVFAAINNKPNLSEERRELLRQTARIALGIDKPPQGLSRLRGAKPLTEPVEIQGTNSENESYIDSLFQAARPGFEYGSIVSDAAYPFRQADANLTESLEEYVDPMTVGQGYTSNIRHGTGTGLLRDKLMEDVSFLTEAGREYNPDDSSFLTKAAGNIGATGATIVEELGDVGRYARSEYEGLGSFLDPDYYRKVFTQPYEDVMANLQGILYSGYGNTPEQKYQNLMNLYAQNQGIFTPALNKVIERAEPGRVVTQQNIADIVQEPPVMTAGREALAQSRGQIAAQIAASKNTQQGNYQAPTMTAQQIVQEAKDTGGTVNPFEVTKAAESSYSRRPNMADVSGPSSSSSSRPRNSPSSSSSRFGRFGRADGGMVSLMDLLNRRV